MKNWVKAIAAGLLGVMMVSCTTTYDANGVARQTVDPAGVAIGAVALGAIAYSVGRSRGERIERRRNHWGYAPVQPHWGGHGYGGHCR